MERVSAATITDTGNAQSTKAIRAPRGEGTTISIDLTAYDALLADIKAAAKQDDREPSKWLRRRLNELAQAGVLFPKAGK